MHNTLKTRALIGAAGLAAAGASILGLTLSSSASASTHPAPPNLSKATSMQLLGSNGKPILGKSGKPITVMVGGPLPAPSAAQTAAAAAASRVPLTQAQVNAAVAAGPATEYIGNQTDQQKAAAIAPGQAATAP